MNQNRIKNAFLVAICGVFIALLIYLIAFALMWLESLLMHSRFALMLAYPYWFIIPPQMSKRFKTV